MEPGLILSFLGASIILTFMPGPDNIYVLTESLTRGHKTGIAISFGLVSGVLVHTLAAATGISIIIQQSAIIFETLKYFGAAYLFYLAWGAYNEKPTKVEFGKKLPSEKSFFHLVRKGFLMNVLNPKVSLFFIAFLPQFITSNGFNPIYQMIILGLIFMIQAFIIFSMVSILSGRFSEQLNNTKFWHRTKWLKTIILAMLGITLLLAKK